MSLALARAFASTGSDESAGLQPDGNAWLNQEPRYGDFALFVSAGKAILLGDFHHAYSDAAVQTGPLALVWAGLLALVLHALHAPAAIGYALSVVVALVPAVYAATLWAASHRPTRWLAIVATGAAVSLSAPWQLHDLFAWQHPTYLWVPSLWLMAAHYARRDRPVPAALLLATACGLETWGVLAAPVVLFALGGWRSRALGSAILATVSGLLWAPFALSESFAMLDVTWVNSRPSPVAVLLGNPDAITWQIRAAQALVIIAVSMVAWLLSRKATDGVIVGVIVISWARVATETQFYPYYRLSLFVATLALVLAAAAHYQRVRSGPALGALCVSGALLSVAQAEALPIPLAANAAAHVLVLAALIGSARYVPVSCDNTGQVNGNAVVKRVGNPPRSRR